MAVDMFIKIDTVDGESKDSKHKKATVVRPMSAEALELAKSTSRT
jgi:hypothetical protein